MKYTFLPTLLLFCLTIQAQSTSKEKLSFPDFNWTISIPANFDRVNEQEWSKMQDQGEAALEDTYGEEVINQARTLFVFSTGEMTEISPSTSCTPKNPKASKCWNPGGEALLKRSKTYQVY